ncbi:MAG: hypothetical protein RLZZ517_338 [Candidatus Parcubacteria bacterium]|jgi:hypothetical protein
MEKEILAVIATLLAVIGNVPYLIQVIKGKIEPHAYTWFVWSVISCIVFFGLLQKGAGIGALPTGVAEFFTIIIFFFSLKNGFKHIQTIDTVFLILALLGLIPWLITKDPTISVIIAVSIDLVAFIPALRKTWKHPKTEAPLLYSMNVSRHALTLLSLRSYNTATMLHSIAMIITNTLMTLFILRKKRK